MKSAHATTVPLLVPLLLLLLDDVVGAEVRVGAGVAPGEGVADEDVDEVGAGGGVVGDGVVELEDASLFETETKRSRNGEREKTKWQTTLTQALVVVGGPACLHEDKTAIEIKRMFRGMYVGLRQGAMQL